MQALDRDLWVEHGPLNLMGLLDLGRTTAAVRIGDGLLLYGPGPGAVGLPQPLPVRYLVCPSVLHDLHLAAAAAAHPAARILGAPGVAARKPDLKIEELDAVAAELEPDLAVFPVDGMPRAQERALLHRPSRTLMVADLLFNLRPGGGLTGRAIKRLTGISAGPSASRLFRMLIKDKPACAASLRRILDEDFDRIVVGHGEVIESGGKATLRGAWGWLL